MAEARTPSTVSVLAAGLLFLLLLPPTGCTREADETRILLIVTVDTLRADHLGSYGGSPDLTPNIDGLARKSVLFERAYAPTSFTLPSVSSLLTGRYPEEIGILSNRSALAPKIPTLAHAFRDRGWRTAAVVSNLVLRANSGLDAGFDLYDDALPDEEATRGWPERVAAGTTDAALSVLDDVDSSGDPLLLWVHYQDPHGPYTPPPELRRRFLAAERARPDGPRRLSPAEGRRHRGHLPAYQVVDGRREVAFYRAGYAAEVHYLDREFGRLLRELTARGLAGSTAILFTADHGESLGERNYWFAHGERIDDPLIRVPLLIHIPGTPAGRRADVVSLVDVAPTLLRHFLGREVPDGTPGRDLLAEDGADRDSIPYLATLGGNQPERFGIIDRGYKFVLSQGPHGLREELYRLGKEDRDLSRSDPDRLEEMRGALIRRRSELRRNVHEHRQRLTDADIRNLEALGYTEAGSHPEEE